MFGRKWAMVVLTVAVGAGMTSSVRAEEIRSNLPHDVAEFVDRSEQCNELMLVEASDDSEEIADAVKELECGRLDRDEARLRRKYRNNVRVIQAIEELNDGGTPALFHSAAASTPAAEKKAPTTSTPDVALAAALVDALNQYERMPIQEAIDYVATKRGLAAAMLKTARQRLRSKASRDPGQAHYQMALSTIAAQSDPMRAVRAQLAK